MSDKPYSFRSDLWHAVGGFLIGGGVGLFMKWVHGGF